VPPAQQPVQDFDAVGTSIDEDEQMTDQRIVMKMILDELLRWWHKGRKPVERLPHVHRLGRNINRSRNAA